ncbi:MAG TPA: bifunctional precorrin-2 dehydrogenase/sirohydrochlorin ferrochelatase [Phycisphaerales bacterium]|nr:bifunctional precorrin-2 dehydrogenase/sirohydrochlorin ferrochelatase [Phycisphaerales bacterium]
MARYPIFLNLQGKRAVVIGAGPVAARKVRGLAEAGARVVVVAPHFGSAFETSCSGPNVELIESTYAKEYLAEALLCIAATNDRTLNQRIYDDCQTREVLCNVVDTPELCDFYVPALVRRGPLQIAISTDGYCPAYAGHVREQLEEMFTELHGRFVEALEQARCRVIERVPDANDRKVLMGEMVRGESFDYFAEHGRDAWQARIDDMIREHT